MFAYTKVGQEFTDQTVIDAETSAAPNPIVDVRLSSDQEDWPEETQRPVSIVKRPLLILLISFFFLTLSVLLYTAGIILLLQMHHANAECPDMEYLEYERRQYNSDVISHSFVGLPTHERRNAWDRLWKTGRISFPLEKLSSINKSTETREWWSLPSPRETEVIAMSEVMHQVHCVGVLWLFAHRNEWDFRALTNRTEDFMKIHHRHCSVLLMTFIKCMADVTPVLLQKDNSNTISGIGLGEWKTRDAPRRCKKFDKLSDWERDNSICPMDCLPRDVLQIHSQ